MKTFAILQDPGHNRVYYKLAGKLAFAELQLALVRCETQTANLEEFEIAGVRYLTFEAQDDLTASDWSILFRLSFVFAVFEVVPQNEEPLLRPCEWHPYAYVDPKIGNLLKYRGKTNELFTKMMINVGLLSSDFSFDHSIHLLDPVAGKGTTLFEGMVYGFDVAGIEQGDKFVQESTLFIKKYMENERYKHQMDKRMVFGKNKQEGHFIHEMEYARSKEEFKDRSERKKWGMVSGSTVLADKYFKNGPYHLIVGDLPYGVAHGNRIKKGLSAGSRNPSDLLTEALPSWKNTLKKGGVIVLAWNVNVVAKHKLSHVVEQQGLKVLTDSPYDLFEHQVDKAIKRDILVIKKE